VTADDVARLQAGTAARDALALLLRGPGDRNAFAAVFHADAESDVQTFGPTACRGHGPTAMRQLTTWLGRAFAELSVSVREVLLDEDYVVVRATISGRHVGTLVVHDANAEPVSAFPGTGRWLRFDATHRFRIRNGLVIGHGVTSEGPAGAGALLGADTRRYRSSQRRTLRRARRELREAFGPRVPVQPHPLNPRDHR